MEARSSGRDELYLQALPVMTTALIQISHLLLAVLVTTSSVHPAHAWSQGTRIRHYGHQAGQTQELLPANSATHDVDVMLPVSPFEVLDADVHGPVDDELAAGLLKLFHDQSTTTASRSLLHGPKKPKKYSRCNSCRMVKCNKQTNFCTGHCRKNKQLFFCSSNSVPFASCTSADSEPPTVEDFEGLPPDNMTKYDTVAVSVPSPYMGCVNIGNRPTGCPARGTSAILPGRMRATVVSARCRAEYYIPACLSPLLPFGVCECVFRITRRPRPTSGRPELRPRVSVAPCSTAVLRAGAGVGGADGSFSDDDLAVVEAGDFTETWFSNFTELGQEPDFTYTVTATSRSTVVNATLSIFSGLVVNTDYLEEGEDISEDYDYDPEDEYVPPL